MKRMPVRLATTLIGSVSFLAICIVMGLEIDMASIMIAGLIIAWCNDA